MIRLAYFKDKFRVDSSYSEHHLLYLIMGKKTPFYY